MEATARAHSNIALIKYWGKRDEALVLPQNSSLSVTLDALYTTTTVRFESSLGADVFVLDGQTKTGPEAARVSGFLDLVRSLARVPHHAVVTSNNQVPTAGGLASSASGFAALAAAAASALDLQVDSAELSRLARQGSGSACRSIYGGFVEWVKGEREDGHDSYAVSIAEPEHWDIRLVIAMVSSNQKDVSSRDGMRRTVQTSPFYAGWLETVEKDLDDARKAVLDRDFDVLGRVVEANALKMHATTLGADPPFCYWNEQTMSVMQAVRKLRAKGVPVYFTMDAGPNVVMLCESSFSSAVQDVIKNLEGVTSVMECKPGPGVRIVKGAKLL